MLSFMEIFQAIRQNCSKMAHPRWSLLLLPMPPTKTSVNVLMEDTSVDNLSELKLLLRNRSDWWVHRKAYLKKGEMMMWWWRWWQANQNSRIFGGRVVHKCLCQAENRIPWLFTDLMRVLEFCGLMQSSVNFPGLENKSLWPIQEQCI